jgi:hypothetical protein
MGYRALILYEAVARTWAVGNTAAGILLPVQFATNTWKGC